MLKHFLNRDYKDLQLYWIFIAGILIIGAIVSLFIPLQARKFISFGIAYVLFLVSTSPVSHVLGSNWRNQHNLSRHYLLALPVSHNRLFFIQQVRIGIFSIPWVLFLMLAPLLFIADINLNLSIVIVFFTYMAYLIVSCYFYIHCLITMIVFFEKFTSHITQSERIRRFIYYFLGTFIVIAIIMLAWSPYITFFKEIASVSVKGGQFKEFKLTGLLFFQLVGGLLLLIATIIPTYWYNKKNWTKS